jgi:hypothetical protein
MDLPDAWALVSEGPARLLGLDDRGRLSPDRGPIWWSWRRRATRIVGTIAGGAVSYMAGTAGRAVPRGGGMRLAALTALVMTAFAANSILNRMAVGPGLIGATDFALIRAVAGAAMLGGLLVLARHRGCRSGRGAVSPGRWALRSTSWGSHGLSRHRRGHRRADPVRRRAADDVRGAVLAGEAMAARRWIGAGLAMAGLAWLVWPAGAVALPVPAVLAMLAAALGWGVYSLVGRRATDPLAETAANFVLAAPLCAWCCWHGRGRGRR